MSNLFWRFLTATAVGMTPGLVMNSLAAEGDASIAGGVALFVLPPFFHYIAGWTCSPVETQRNPHINQSPLLGPLSVTLPSLIVFNAITGVPPAAILLSAIILTAKIVGLSFTGAKAGLGARAQR